MPVNHYINNQTNLIVTTWEGEAIDIDLIKALKKYQNEIQSNSDYIGYDEIVDFSKMTSIKLSTDGLKNIGKIASRSDQYAVKTKLAIIVSSSLAFGIARMYMAYRSFEKNSSKEICVFSKEIDALEWIQNDT